MSEDFTLQLIDETYQKVIHIADDGYLVDGTGSYININVSGSIYSSGLINGVGLTAAGTGYKFLSDDGVYKYIYIPTASYDFVTTASFNAFTQSYYNDSQSFDYRITNISIDTGSFITSTSFNNFTQSYYNDSGSFDLLISNLNSVSHSHNNKPLLDSLYDTGSGDLFLSDNGTYKTITSFQNFEQSFISSSYIIVSHSFGIYPSVTIIDTFGSEIEGKITHDVNRLQCIVEFNKSISGIVICTSTTNNNEYTFINQDYISVPHNKHRYPAVTIIDTIGNEFEEIGRASCRERV